MQINADFEFVIKLIIIGDTGVGKTNFIFRYTQNQFSPLHVTTVGFDSKYKIIKLPKYKKKVKVQIFDTAGQERYMSLNKSQFHKVQGIILMYDITERDSFDNVTKWLDLINQTVTNKAIFLIANKIDKEDQRIVSVTEGEKLARENNILFFEGSGATGENVSKIFEKIAEKIYTSLTEDKNEEEENGNVILNDSGMNLKKKKCCSKG